MTTIDKDTQKKASDKAAKVLLIIPAATAVLGIVLFIAACLLEGPDSRGTLYSVVAILAIACYLLALMPGVILAVIGTVRAARAKMTGFLVLGIIELIGSVIPAIILFIIIFVTGPGV